MGYFKRRQFLATLGATAATCSWGALAQRGNRRRLVGVLSFDAEASGTGRQQREFLTEALDRVGYRSSDDLAIEWRFAEGKRALLTQRAEELARLKVDIIVTLASVEATVAAARATRTIPIVMHNFPGAPIELGLAGSLAKPGGNVTGTTYSAGMSYGKGYEILKEAAPRTVRVAALWDPRIRGARGLAARTNELVRKELGIAVTDFLVERPEDVTGTLQKIAASRPDALVVATDPVVRVVLRQIVTFAIEKKLISMSGGLIGVREGLLLYYGPDLAYMFFRTARVIDRILRGANPADLPIELPLKYELVVNAKTARAIGWKIPAALLLRVDRTIE